MCECLVGLRHLVRIFLFLDRCARIVRSIHQLCREACIHRLLAAQTRIADKPADTECHAAIRTNLNRHLIVGTADTACLNLEHGHDVAQSRLEHLKRILPRLLANRLERIIDDALCDALLAREHNLVDKLRHRLGMIYRIRQNIPLRHRALTWHSPTSLTIYCLTSSSHASRRTSSAPVRDPAHQRYRATRE